MDEPKILHVVYKCIDGAHIFSSADPFVQGLYAASTDLKAAYEDVPVQAKMLLNLNHGIDDEVTHQVPYEEFLKQLLTAVSGAIAGQHRAGHNDRGIGVLPPSRSVSLRMSMKAA